MLPMPVAVPSPKQKHRRPDPGPAAVLDSTRRREGGTPPATAAGNQLLAEHVAAYPYTPPRDVQRWTSTAIEKQLAQGVDPEMVRIGLSLLRSDQKANPQRDIGPGLLPKYVDQALRGIRPGNIRPRGQENALDVLARVKAKMQAGDGGFRTAAPFDADRIVDSFAVNYGETA
ncbi:hypothetical protein MXD63_14830 [Frankia sp. Cpl3]|nr:hypothetical protein [Frankia sp. Cpl3]